METTPLRDLRLEGELGARLVVEREWSSGDALEFRFAGGLRLVP